jgi:hypothetical protein
MRNNKIVNIRSGREEGFVWVLFLDVRENTKKFSGSFYISGKLENHRATTRSTDRKFFMARLGRKYMADKVLHHSWIENSADYIKVILLHKSEHPNGGIDVDRGAKLKWIAKEIWL